jgi:hypothetical protein
MYVEVERTAPAIFLSVENRVPRNHPAEIAGMHWPQREIPC